MQNDGSISPVRQFFRNKWVRIILAIDVLAILVVIGMIIWNATKTATINFDVAPIDAIIQIDGKGDYQNGTYHVHPGNHKITISHDSLTTKTFNIELQSGYSTALITFLSDNGNFSFYELINNYTSFEKLSSIASKENNITTDQDKTAEDFITNTKHIMSIMEKMPIKGYVYANNNANASSAGFTIRDGRSKMECQRAACLLVNYYGNGYEETVKKKITEAGYNPSDYQIIYERYN